MSSPKPSASGKKPQPYQNVNLAGSFEDKKVLVEILPPNKNIDKKHQCQKQEVKLIQTSESQIEEQQQQSVVLRRQRRSSSASSVSTTSRPGSTLLLSGGYVEKMELFPRLDLTGSSGTGTGSTVVHHHIHHHVVHNQNNNNNSAIQSPLWSPISPVASGPLYANHSISGSMTSCFSTNPFLPPSPISSPSNPFATPPAPAPMTNIPEVLSRNRNLLEESGWYHEKLSWSESVDLLKDTTEGTFLVRDSAEPRFLFTLSVQRSAGKGPTSVRIHFAHGKFWLDAEEKIQHLMPKFDTVVDLIGHYLKLSASQVGKSHVWVDNSGQLDSPICLTRPLYHSRQPPSLAHFARLAINANLISSSNSRRTSGCPARYAGSGSAAGYAATTASISDLAIPNRLKTYLTNYPYKM